MNEQVILVQQSLLGLNLGNNIIKVVTAMGLDFAAQYWDVVP